jgi:hypothetical protein
MSFYNFSHNFSCLVTNKRYFLLTAVVFCIYLAIMFSSSGLLSTVNGQPASPSNVKIGIGSKFQVILEGETIESTDGVIYRETVAGEVQLYPLLSSLDNGFIIKGFGRGTFSNAYSPCNSDSVNYNAFISGSIVDQGNGYNFISIGGVPVSSSKLSQDVTLIEPDATDILEYFGSDNKCGVTMGIANGHANVTYGEMSSGLNIEDKTGSGDFYTRTKMVVTPPALKYDILGTVKGIAKVKGTNPMSNSKVVIIDAEELKKKTGNKFPPSTGLKLSDLQLPFEQKTTTSDDDKAKYSFTIDGKGKVLPTMLVVSLLWYDKEKGGGGEFAVTTGPEKEGKKIPVYMISCVGNLYPGCQPWKPNKAKDGFEANLDFVYGDVEHPDMEKEDLYPRSPSRTVIQYDAAAVYYNSYKAIKYFESLKGQVPMTLNPVTIDIYDSVSVDDCIDEKTKADIDNAFYSESSVPNIGGMGTKLEPVKSAGGMITICKLDSRANYPDAPDMREYHELGHYLQKAMYYPNSPVQKNYGTNHAGYENSGTNDSLGEGFASFVTLLINEHYKVGNTKTQSSYRLGDTRVDIERDYKVWGDHVKLVRDTTGKVKVIDVNYNGPPDQEERAVTGILWDLHDKTMETSHSGLSTFYKTSKDDISLPDWQILKVISDKDPMNLVQLHDEFVANTPQDKVDMIFINHGAFADTLIRNLIQEVPAELPGFTGDTRTDPDRHNRMKEPLTPGSYIIAQNDATFNISFIHEAPYGGYDYSYLVNMTKGKLTYFEMAPSYYPSKAIFNQVTLNGNESLVKNAITIDSNEYWDYIYSNPKYNQKFKTIPTVVDNTQQKPYDIHEDPRFSGNSTLTNSTVYGIQNSNISSPQNNSNTNPSNASTSIVSSDNTSIDIQSLPREFVTTNATATPVLTYPQNSTSNISATSNNNTSNTTSAASNETYVTIKMLPVSSPLFFKCNISAENGSSTLPGLDAAASLGQVLIDNNSDTHLAGNATFDIIFETPLVDRPGPDLIINESGSNMESFSVGILTNDNATYGSLNVVGGSSGSTDNCGNQINTYQLDFSSIPHKGNTISGLRIDNDPDKNGGAELSDITAGNYGKLLTYTTDDKPTFFTANDTLNN